MWNLESVLTKKISRDIEFALNTPPIQYKEPALKKCVWGGACVIL